MLCLCVEQSFDEQQSGTKNSSWLPGSMVPQQQPVHQLETCTIAMDAAQKCWANTQTVVRQKIVPARNNSP